MVASTSRRVADYGRLLADQFKTRDFIFHDGRELRRFSIAGRTQAAIAGVAGISLCFSAYGVAQVAAGAVEMSGVLGTPATPEAKLARMQRQLSEMQAKVDAVRAAAKAHAARIEERQKLIAAVLSGKTNARVALTAPAIDASVDAAAADVIAPLRAVEARQLRVAARARQVAEQRYQATAGHFRRLGLEPERFMPAMGGPYEPVTSTLAVTDANADAQFRSLFMTWKKLETLEKAVIAIPATQPVERVSFTSYFGVRSDPFRGTAAMHAGVDIPGVIGTPVYATADGIIARAERSGGYGNLIEVDHGRGIATRYGHLSRILVAPNTRVKRGQLIGLMGSTGRSTGSHLHYEVRIDGQAVNPMPFLQTADYLRGAAPVAPTLVSGGTDAAAE